MRTIAWSIAIAIEVGGTLLVGGHAFRVSASHFAERHSLVLIIVLGEAVVALGGQAVASDLDLPATFGLLGGFVLVATLWWSYFAWAFGSTEDWLRGKGRPFRPGDASAVGRMARDAFTFGHFPMVWGLIAMAVAASSSSHSSSIAKPSPSASVSSADRRSYTSLLIKQPTRRRSIGSFYPDPRVRAAHARRTRPPLPTPRCHRAHAARGRHLRHHAPVYQSLRRMCVQGTRAG